MPPCAPEAVSPTQRQGARAESLACAHLEAQGFRILARNLQARTGEIDIAGMDGPVLAFVEVRQRSNRQFGGAAASVGPRKQARLARTAQIWLPRLAERFLASRTPPCRFDVVAVHPEGVQWLKHAFNIP